MPGAQEKTEKPTPRRREEARREGDVARSQDLSAGVLLLTGTLLLGLLGPALMAQMVALLRFFVSPRAADMPLHVDGLEAWVWLLLVEMLRMIGPFALIMVLAAVVVQVGQVGALLTFKPLRPRLSRLNPIQGLKRIFSLRGLVRLAFGVGKMVVVVLVAALTIWQYHHLLMRAQGLEERPLLGMSGWLVYTLAWRVALALLILGILDYIYQRWQHERKLMMTREEVKEELRRSEGDPRIKRRQRNIQFQMALQRMRAAVPRADVVVTNPTELAIALKYDPQTMNAPKCVAKGQGFMARRIREIAAAHGVPIVERKALAQALYRAVEVGQEIPEKFYRAIAEVLAYVYELKGWRAAGAGGR